MQGAAHINVSRYRHKRLAKTPVSEHLNKIPKNSF